jgi:CRP-like cAMP-binding protein
MTSGRTRMLRLDDLQLLRRRNAGRAIDQFLLAVLIEPNRALTAQLVELLFTPTAKRIERQLLHLAELGIANGGDGWIRISQNEPAMMTATTRATVNRSLRDLEKRGIIESIDDESSLSLVHDFLAHRDE